MEFKQVLNVLPSCNGQTAQSTVNFCHVRNKPLAIQLILAGSVNFGDLPVLAQLLNPSPDGFKRHCSEFIFVEWIVEFSVEATAVTHQSEEFSSVGWNGCFVGVVRGQLFAAQFGGQGTRTEQALKDGRVDVLDEERPCLHRHEVLKGRHEERHTEARGNHDLRVNDSGIARHARREEVLKTDEVDVPKHDFAFGLPHQQAGFASPVLLQERLCPLLELLRTDLF